VTPPSKPGIAASASALEARLKHADEDRWLASRYAPAPQRDWLVLLACLRLELQKALATREPMLGKIRLQWWREALAAIAAGGPAREHELGDSLAAMLAERPDLLAPALALVDRYDDVLDDHLAGGHSDSPDHAARHAAAEVALTRLSAQALEAAAAGAAVEGLDACGEAAFAAQADLPDAGAKRAEAARLARRLPASLWPAIAHLAARRGDAPGPLARRWRVFRAVLTRRL
jgi:phytoene synthase